MINNQQANTLLGGGGKTDTVIMTVGSRGYLVGYSKGNFGELSKIPYWWAGSVDGNNREERILTHLYSNERMWESTIGFEWENKFIDYQEKIVKVKVTPSANNDIDTIESGDLNNTGSNTVYDIIVPTEIGTKVTLTFDPPPDGFL